ncbi:hypothetical protein BJV82DRAFT_665779 [Fennellomyces sp. T-0311]|nr:hypothetical protein BJV82DRAFT_665779 [Fennellomyces sp. T-0311]
MSIKFGDGAMDAMLSHCPSLMELTLLGTWPTKINLQVVLSSFPQLELIQLQDIGLSYYTDQAITRLFEELTANRSKINSITLSCIGPTPDTLLIALSLLLSLKHLEIELDQNAYADDVLCQTLQRLGRTPIESLYINNLRCVPEAATTALYKLSRLRN